MREMVVDLRRLTRQSAEMPTAPTFAWRGRPWRRFGVLAALVLLIAAGAVKWLPRAGAVPIHSIAVLPLANLSGDPNQEYFSEGTTEALISSLAQIHSLEVIGRTSVLRYKGTTKTAREIGQELGVDAVVEGSIQRSGGRVRIAAQLIRTSTDKDLWANHYDRDLSDVLKLESDVAQAIAQEIQAQVTPQELIRLKNARSVVPAAREEFLLGRYNLWKNSDEALANAIPHFERAIQLQPDYADAYANLALAWENRLPLGYPKPKEALEAARPAALKSLELDPTLSEAHVAMGTVDVYNWNWAGAEAHFQRAVELDLYNNLETCGCYTSYLWATGRFSESLNLADRFARADPLSSATQFNDGLAHYGAKRYAEAVPLLERALELDPQDRLSRIVLSETYARLGREKDALVLLDRPEFRTEWPMGMVYALSGRRAEALKIVHDISKPGSNPDPRSLAIIYFALGDKEQGFKWLTKAVDAHHPLMVMLKNDPPYEGVRSDPRFQALVKRMNLP